MLQRCAACYSANLSVQLGVLICDNCGAQAQARPPETLRRIREVGVRSDVLATVAGFLLQAFVEEEQEWQEGIDNSRHRRSTRHTSSIKKPQAPVQALSLPDAVQCYCRCMQHMLQVHPLLWLLRLLRARQPSAGLPTGEPSRRLSWGTCSAPLV